VQFDFRDSLQIGWEDLVKPAKPFTVGLLVVATLWHFGAGLLRAQPPAMPEITIDRDNIQITKSVQIKPGRYVVADTDGNGVLQIASDNVVVDFRGAVLVSRKDVQAGDKDQYDGIGIAVQGRQKVTIKNAGVQGFRFNLKAKDCDQLLIEGGDYSHSRAQRIGRNGKAINIFLELRDVNAWREYGSAIWLETCKNSSVTDCRANSSQNGICLVSCEGCTVHHNDFSFNSGWGIALWSSENNVVSWNFADFCNRPGEWAWGEDSAGLAMANSSHRNFIIGNSLTHGGDGFFLTDGANMGVRPSDDNVVAYNDGSWSPHNAFESTFSTGNVFYRNIASESVHGFWLGWSWDNLMIENRIERSSESGISIEYGGRNRMERNMFTGAGKAAIHLWSEDPKTGVSREYTIVDNDIQDVPQAILLQNTTDLFLKNNRLQRAPLPAGLSSTMKEAGGLSREEFLATPKGKRMEEIVAKKPKGFTYFRDQTKLHGLELLRGGDFAPLDIRGQLGIRVRKK